MDHTKTSGSEYRSLDSWYRFGHRPVIHRQYELYRTLRIMHGNLSVGGEKRHFGKQRLCSGKKIAWWLLQSRSLPAYLLALPRVVRVSQSTIFRFHLPIHLSIHPQQTVSNKMTESRPIPDNWGRERLMGKSVSFKGMPPAEEAENGKAPPSPKRKSKSGKDSTKLDPMLWGQPGHLTEAETDVYVSE
jgi:hypothetical protein